MTDEMIRNKNFKEIEMIFKNKKNSKSNQQKNLTVSKLVHLENDDKILSRRNENF
jgi:hypothetical protein